jgi:hypothetical protein
MVKIPTVHLNGTSKKELLTQQRRIYDACEVLMVALREAMPHDRDYYVQDSSAGSIAREAHRVRLALVDKIKADAVMIYQGISEQGK